MARFHVAILLLVAVVGSIQCCDHETKAVTELEAKELGQFNCYGKSDGNYPDPADSSHYWQCVDGQRYYKICPANMHFDNKARRCVPGSPSVDGIMNCIQVTGGQFNCYGKSDGNYPDPADSSHYWQCVDGQRYYKKCPENMHFDNKPRRCVPGSPSGQFNCYGKSDGNYPDPADSSHYWQCVDGQRYYKTCPANLHFDDKARRCVPGSPSEAQCAEKQKASLKLKDILKA